MYQSILIDTFFEQETELMRKDEELNILTHMLDDLVADEDDLQQHRIKATGTEIYEL